MAGIQQISFLEKSLNLSKNGGVHYAGARVGADEQIAVLVVGLGGSGAEMLLRIKHRIKTRMILPSDKTGAPVADIPKNIGFLEIDMDSTTEKLAYGAAHFDPSEVCNIWTTPVPDMIADIHKAKESGAECWQWLGDEGLPLGPSGMLWPSRMVGRMFLAYNMKEVVKTVDGKLNKLIQDNPGSKELLICVCSGISGCTGGGILLDMAYILQKAAKKRASNVTAMGYLLMPDVNERNGGKKEILRARGFASLKELDYWMNSDKTGERYNQKFPNGFELNEQGHPFDFCHLLNASDTDGHLFTYDGVLGTVAENVFACIAGEVKPGLMLGVDQYLAPGTSEIRIPYTEIATLIVARLFERLDGGMFKNRPTEAEFEEKVKCDLELAEEKLCSAFYRNVTVPRPMLYDKEYKYADVWPNNAPYQAAYNWLEQFRRSVMQQAETLPVYLEGKLKEFIRRNLRDNKTGPVYLRYFVKSDQGYCLYQRLRAFRRYCLELRAQREHRSGELKDIMQQSYAEGMSLKLGVGRRRVLKNYLAVLEDWYRNEELAFLSEKMAEVIETMMERLELYYENILRPLTDILLELPYIFKENVGYIRVYESRGDEGTHILIRPLEFEQTRKNDFEAAVRQAENRFLASLSTNIRKWIGRDIGDVDEETAADTDVEGFISDFISMNFQPFLTINMESIMNTKLRDGESLEDYIKMHVEDLLNTSRSLYKGNAGLTEIVQEFFVIFVPVDCPIIYKVTKKYIEERHLMNRGAAIVKSKEKSRMRIMKITGGYPLYANDFIQEMKAAYETLNRSDSIWRHQQI